MDPYSQKISPIANFCWVIENKLAASSIPTDSTDYAWLTKDQGIQVIISLVEDEILEEFPELTLWREQLKFQHYHIPTLDGTGFTIPQFYDLCHIYEVAIRNNKSVLIHCYAGIGRTATALIGLLMYLNDISYKDARDIINIKRPMSMLTNLQRLSLSEWETELQRYNTEHQPNK